jgi:hypothetical protein
MAAGALFAGAAAQATDQSLRSWRELWERQSAREQQQKQFEQTLTFQREQQLNQQAFQERLQKMQQEFQLGVLDRNEAFKIGELALEQLPTLDLDAQWNVANILQETGNPLAPLISNSIRQGLFDNPSQAIAEIEALFTAEPGTKFNPVRVRMAADVYAARAGLSGPERDAFFQNVESLVEEYNSGAEEIDTLKVEALRTTVAQGKASLAKTEAETARLDADTQAIFQGMNFEADKHQFILDNLALNNALLKTQANIAQLQYLHLPQEMAANLRLLHAQAQQLENGSELFQRTLEHQVRQIAAAADLGEEEARHAVATGLARDAIVFGNLEQLRAAIDLTRAQTELVAAQAGLTEAQADLAILAGSETRISIMNDLVELGRGDLIRAVGPDLLTGLGLDDRAQAEVLDQLVEIANRRGDRQERIDEANAVIAMAQANVAERTVDARVRQEDATARQMESGARVAERTEDIAVAMAQTDLEYSQWRNRVAESQRQFDNWAKAYGLQTDRMQAEAYAASVRHQTMPKDLSVAEIHNAVRTATGINLNNIQDAVSDWRNAEADLLRFRHLVREGNVAEIHELANRYGFSPDNLENAEAYLELLVANRKSHAEGLVTSYVDAGLSYGTMFTPEQLGLERDSPVYHNAVRTYPFVRPTYEGVGGEVWRTVDKLAGVIAPQVAGVGDSSLGHAKAVYDQLRESYSLEELGMAGIHQPSDLVDFLNQAAREHGANAEAAAAGAQRVSQILGGTPVDLNNRDVRENAIKVLESNSMGLEAIANKISNANFGGSFLPGLWTAYPDDQTLRQLGRDLVAVSGMSREELTQLGVLDPQGRIRSKQAALTFINQLTGQQYEQIRAIQYIHARDY